MSRRRRSSWCRNMSAAPKAGRRWPSIGGRAVGESRKSAAESAVTDLAADMLELQAARAARPGISFRVETAWQQEFDAAFPYQETRDQLTAIAAIKARHAAPRGRWTACCAATWASARPKWPCGRRSKAIDRRLPGGGAGADDRSWPSSICGHFPPRMAAFPFTIAALSRFSTPQGSRRKMLEAAGRRRGRHRHRHASPGAGRRAISKPGPGDHRRRAAVWRRGQGAAQGACGRPSTC